MCCKIIKITWKNILVGNPYVINNTEVNLMCQSPCCGYQSDGDE